MLNTKMLKKLINRCMQYSGSTWTFPERYTELILTTFLQYKGILKEKQAFLILHASGDIQP